MAEALPQPRWTPRSEAATCRLKTYSVQVLDGLEQQAHAAAEDLDRLMGSLQSSLRGVGYLNVYL